MLHQRNRWHLLEISYILCLNDSNDKNPESQYGMWFWNILKSKLDFVVSYFCYIACDQCHNVTSCRIIGVHEVHSPIFLPLTAMASRPFRNHLTGILSLAMGWRKSSLDSLELDNGNLRTGPHSNAETSSIRQTSQRSWWYEPQRWGLHRIVGTKSRE